MTNCGGELRGCWSCRHPQPDPPLESPEAKACRSLSAVAEVLISTVIIELTDIHQIL